MVAAQTTERRHTVVVRYIDRKRQNQEASFADWTRREATVRAWKFMRPKVLHGDALCFRFIHAEQCRL